MRTSAQDFFEDERERIEESRLPDPANDDYDDYDDGLNEEDDKVCDDYEGDDEFFDDDYLDDLDAYDEYEEYGPPRDLPGQESRSVSR